MDELPAPGPVRKSKSHLSVISHDDDYDNDNNSYYVGRSGHKIPMYSTRSDDQVLPYFAAYNTGKGKPGSTPIHLLDDQRRHSALAGGDVTAKDDVPKSSGGGGGGQGITGSSTYDSLAKLKESVDKLEKSSSSNSRSSKAKSSTMDHQVKIYHSPLSQDELKIPIINAEIFQRSGPLEVKVQLSLEAAINQRHHRDITTPTLTIRSHRNLRHHHQRNIRRRRC